MAGKVLIVDDEEAVRFFITHGLKRAGWQVYQAHSGENALATLDTLTPCDVILLDLHLGGLDGLTVMRRIKERWPEAMIIIITAHATLDSAIEAIRHEVFDYLRKPLGIGDIIATINRALVKKKVLEQLRSQIFPAGIEMAALLGSRPVIQSGELIINLDAHTVTLAGQPIPLTPTEYELLAILAQAPCQSVSITRLIQEGLRYDVIDSQAKETLRVHISRLRRKLGRNYIFTVRSGGYTLVLIP